jgi:Protein kinase domain
MEAFPRRWGAYVLIRPLGGGGMGDVFLALQSKPGREKLCVVKRLIPNKLSDPDRVGRFRREAEIVRSLAHGAIAQTLAVDELDGEPYIVQEFIEGRNISQLVAASRSVDRGAIPPNLAIHIVREVSRALAYAHGAGVVHRDVAPDNVMVTFSGEVRLIDFGIAHAARDPSLTEPGVVVGRWNYTAPEVLAGARADRRADVYAAGMLLWELLTGRPPSFADLEASPAPSRLKPGLSADIDAVVSKATAADPTRRFASADDLQRALGPLLPRSFVGEQALREFVGRCYDVEVQRRRLADEVAEARALLVEAPSPAAHPRSRGLYVVAGASVCLAVAAVVFARHRSVRQVVLPISPSVPAISLAGCTLLLHVAVNDGQLWNDLGQPVPGANGIGAFVAVNSHAAPVVSWAGLDGTTSAALVATWSGTAWNASPPIDAAAGATVDATVLRLDSQDRPVVAFRQTTSAGSDVFVVRWNGSAWDTSLGELGLTSAQAFDLTLDDQGSPLVGVVDSSFNGVAVWNGTAWVKNPNAGASTPSLALDSMGNPVTLSNWRPQHLTNGTWLPSVSTAIAVNTGAEAPHLTSTSDHQPVVAWVDPSSPPGGIALARWTGSGWDQRSGLAQGDTNAPSGLPPAVVVDARGSIWIGWLGGLQAFVWMSNY